MRTTVTVKNQVEELLGQLNEELYGKEETMKIVLLAILAGESAFLLGEPGTAKSMISRRIADAFEDLDESLPKNRGMVKYYEYLMNQFSTPDEVFGPVSLESLKKDEYKRITDRFLPKAKFAFLDEIWKASPAIQNALLTILNEKKFHNGSSAENVPLIGFIAASNELPQKDAGLEAIFDRFLVRLLEKPIQKDSDFFDMITSPKSAKVVIKSKLTEKLVSQWQAEAENITLPEDCRQLIRNIRKTLAVKNNEENRDDEDKYLISDRRWKKIVGLLRMCAYINGRTEVNLSDCVIIPYCLWSTEIQENEIFEIVIDLIGETLCISDVNADDLIGEFEKIKNDYEKKRLKQYADDLAAINFPGGAKSLIKTKRNFITELEKNKLNPILQIINDTVSSVENDFEKNTKVFCENIFKNEKLEPSIKKIKNNGIESMINLKAKIEEYNLTQLKSATTNFIELDKTIRDIVTVVTKLYKSGNSAAIKKQIKTVQQSIIPAINERIEAESQFAQDLFTNQNEIFGEAVLSSKKFQSLLMDVKKEIDQTIADSKRQIDEMDQIATMILKK